MYTERELADMDKGSLIGLVRSLQAELARANRIHRDTAWPSDEQLAEQVREALNQ